MRSHHFLPTTFLVFSLFLFPTLATAASPHIYDAPQAGPPGSQTAVVGNGFDPNAIIDLYLDSTDVGLVITDNNGSFGMALKAPTIRQNGLTIQIPKDAVPGQHWITAVERITQIQAQVAFTVWTDWPKFHFDLGSTGYNPLENVLGPETVGNLTTRWKFATGGYVGSPTIANGVVYIGTSTGNYGALFALNAATGALLWKYTTQGGVATATVANGVVYFGSVESQNVYALNAATGELLWQYTVERGVVASPAVVNGVVYVGDWYRHFYALDAATGALIWKDAIAGAGSPALANGVVYVVGDEHNMYALDANTGTQLWMYAMGGNIFSWPAVVNGVVYVGSANGFDSIMYALNATTGALLWASPPGNIIESSPAVANDVVYIGNWDSNMYALDANTGAQLWRYTTGNVINTAAAVANGVVYFGSGDHNLYALNASTGALLWQYPGDFSPPAVINGMVYVGSDDGYLYAFGLPNQQMSEQFSPPERPDPARLTPNWSPTLKK